MTYKPLMILGSSSHAGKTTIVAGLCRLFANRGLTVAPFKSQNMSLNSFATLKGEEIARSTAVQAFAAKQEPSIHMNPILLKPKSDTESQLIMHGKVYADIKAKEYFYEEIWYRQKLNAIQASVSYLRNHFDLIIAEGAGSCAEPNFLSNDLVNLGMARLLNADAYLTVDIDKGGVFADILGTLKILELVAPEYKKYIKGILINKFRGDESVLQPAIDFVTEHSGIPVVGVIPYLSDLCLEEEDRIKNYPCHNPEIDIAVIYLPHISNANDFNSLAMEKNIRVRFVRSVETLGSPDMIIIPGTKSTIWDLEYLKKIGLEKKIQSLLPNTPLMGICGGFEMMGQRLYDPQQIESNVTELWGLGLFDFDVTFRTTKTVTQVKYQPSPANIFSSAGEVSGYEIHCGEVHYGKNCSPLYLSDHGVDGAISENPLVFGTFVHDIFKNPLFTRVLINHLRKKKGLMSLSGPLPNPEQHFENQCDELAQVLEKSCPAMLKQYKDSCLV